MVERQRQSMADLVEEPAKKTSGQVWVGLTDDEAMELVGAAPGMVRIRAVRTIYPEEDKPVPRGAIADISEKLYKHFFKAGAVIKV